MNVRASNSLGPMWCAPHIEGQYLRDEITKIVTECSKQDRDWFHDVYDLLEKHQIQKPWREQLYRHATGVADQITYQERKKLMTDRYDRAIELLEDLYALANQANKDAFKNGVTDCSGTTDEGDVRAGQILGEVRQFLQEDEKHHINARRVEEACRRWWEVERDGKRVATMSWDDAVQKFSTENPAAIADYRLRAAAALGIKL